MIRSLSLGFLLAYCSASVAAAEPLDLESPNGQLQLRFALGENQEPTYDIAYKDVPIVSGTLGLKFAGSGPLGPNLKIIGTKRSKRDETYAIPVGKASSARDHHHELTVSLEEQTAPGRILDVAFRAFNDGIAFRYQIPKQESLAEFVLTGEDTRFTFPGNPKARVLPLGKFTTPYEKYGSSQK